MWLNKSKKLIAIGVNSNAFLVCQYLFKHRIFKRLNIENSMQPLRAVYRSACTKNITEEYLFIFGGRVPYFPYLISVQLGLGSHPELNDYDRNLRQDFIQNGVGDTNNMYVINLKTMRFYSCKLKCPPKSKGPMRAICMSNKARDEIMVFGFVNQFIRGNCDNNNLMFNHFPHYLTQIIIRYIWTEDVHIMCGFHHWKINIDEILSSIIV